MPHLPESVQTRSRAFAKEIKEVVESKTCRVGTVYLVGAGPGDPGLITVRGQECLGIADAVLYDGLANSRLLDSAIHADCQSVGKHGQTEIWTQTAINERMIELARAGKTVVRLKGGDPAVFARTAEELDVLQQAGIPFEVVPGITAALAAASYAGIPITHRQHASAVAFITGQQQATAPPQSIDWRALSDFPGTLVFYMGVTTAESWTSSLLSAGKPGGTPAAIVRRCTWSDQRVVRCRLDEVAGKLTPASKMRPPVIVIVGDVAVLGEQFDWFSQRPLHGCGILVTRPVHQSTEITAQLQQLGADVYHQPVIELKQPADFAGLDDAISRLAQAANIQGITFSSTNGVDGFMRRIAERRFDSRIFAGCTIAAVGPATARALASYGLQADIIPADKNNYSAAGLLNEFDRSIAGDCWIVTTTNGSRNTLQIGLKERGATVQEALSYESRPVTDLRSSVVAALDARKIQYCTVTSTLIAQTAHQLLQAYRSKLAPISISEKVSAELISLAWPPVAEARQNSVDSLVQAVCRSAEKSKNE